MRKVLFVGNHRYDDFHGAVEWLDRNSCLTLAKDATGAREQIGESELCPELIVLAQSHPGQFTCSAVERLAGLVPLSRLVMLLGSWCESETRIGEPCPGVTRLYWHQFSARLTREFLQGEAPPDSTWDLPRTCTTSEQWLTLSATPVNRQTDQKRLLAIRTETLDSYQTLADALNHLGFATAWVSPGQRPFVSGIWAGIWDSAMLNADDTSRLQEFRAWLGPAPMIALVNFPRVSDWYRLRSLGVSAVLGKPCALSDLTSLLSETQ